MKKFILTIFTLLFGNFALSADVTILHTSDIHGRISPIEYRGIKDMGGFSRRVTFINGVRKQNKNVLLLDSGDYFQGSLYYRLDYGKLSDKLLPYIKYDAITLGNHEFDDGIKVLRNNVKRSKTQFISANVHFKDKYLCNNVKPYITRSIDNEKFLIIGVTTPSLTNLSNTNSVIVTDPVVEIKKIISNVNFDRLIVVSHCGLDEDRRIAKEIPQIDLILGGHNHYFFETPKYTGDTPIIQDGEFGVRVGIIDFDNKLRHYKYQNITNSIKPDLKVDKIISNYDKKISRKTSKVITKLDTQLIGEQNIIERNQTNLGRLILKCMIQEFPNYDVVLNNSGSIIVNRNLREKITYADVLEILPFKNKVVLLEIQGKYLKDILISGQQTGRRYLQVHKNTSDPINDTKYYRVVTNSYIAEGKDNYPQFKNGKILKISHKTQSEILIKYLKKYTKITEKDLIL